VVTRAARQGLTVWVGVADGKLTARLAARAGRGVDIVPPGGSSARLAPLPITLLEPDSARAATLESGGRRCRDVLTRVPAGAVAHRLGPAGVRLVRLARGEDDAPLAACPTPRVFTETIELDYVIERLEPLVFVLRRLLDCLTRRLALHGLACAALDLDLQLAGGGRIAHRIAVAAPTTESKTLLTLLRAHIERVPPGQAVCGVALGGEAARVRAAQLDFFQPSGPSPAVLAATIAGLAALCGPDRVGAPARTASHRPDAVTLVPFPGSVDVCAASGVDHCREKAAGYGPAVVAPVALRAFRPPAPLTVFESAGRLDYVRGPGFGGRVVHIAGPWRLRGEWWTADPFAREYYDVELSDGGVYRIYRDGRRWRWLADGLYD
jgi:protein ImuB